MKRSLWKRNDGAALRAKFDEGTARLAVSVASIINDPSANKNAMLGRTFGQYLDHVSKLTGRKTSLQDIVALKSIFVGKNLDVSTPKAKDDEGFGEDDPDRDDESDEGGNDGESKDQLERAERAMKGNNMQTHSELMSAVVKKYGLTAFAKSVVAGDVHCTESDLCKLIEQTA
jgi:hypothetical protein